MDQTMTLRVILQSHFLLYKTKKSSLPDHSLVSFTSCYSPISSANLYWSLEFHQWLDSPLILHSPSKQGSLATHSCSPLLPVLPTLRMSGRQACSWNENMVLPWSRSISQCYANLMPLVNFPT